MGEKLITQTKKEEVAALIGSSSNVGKDYDKDEVNSGDKIKDSQQIGSVYPPDREIPKSKDTENDDEIEDKLNAHEDNEQNKTEDKKVPATDEVDQIIAEDEEEKETKPTSHYQQQQQQQKSEISLVETDNDPISSVFSPADSIRTEELDLALEEHRR